MNSYLPINYIRRPPEEKDIAAIIELIFAFDMSEVGAADLLTADDIHSDWETLDLATDAWCLFSADGELAAYGTLWSHDASSNGRIVGDGYVHPVHKGRGLGSLLLDLMETRAAEVLPGQPEGTRMVLQNNIVISSPASRTLLESRGYTLSRVFFTMHIDLDQRPAPTTWPENIHVRACDGSEEDIRRAYEAIEESMLDHFAHTPRGFEEWQQNMVRESFDPSLWLLAMDGDQVAGVSLCRVWNEEIGQGWVSQLGVRTPWRKRGLGSALLQHSFDIFFQRGFKRVGLGVDSKSLTGAQRIYERAGMHVTMRVGRYEKELRSGRELHPGRID